MKKTILILLFPLLYNVAISQDKAGAEKLVEEGVAYHDKGDYESAILRYNKALELDKDNALAFTEKAMSLLSLQKYEESISCCRKVIEIYPGTKVLKSVYVTYGNAYDGLQKADKSIEIYDEGIKLFPDFYQLYFNKGITLTGVRKYEDALLCFQKSVTLNPKHASSHNAIARLKSLDKKRIPALLAYCRFLSIEQESNRAKENLAGMQKIMKGDVTETGKNAVTINIDASILADTTADGTARENSFSSTDLILALDAGLDNDKKNVKKTAVEQFIRKFDTVCASLEETRKNNYGFYWSYYVPYFKEMKDKKLIESFAYIAFSSSGDEDVLNWLSSHKMAVEKFFTWSDAFQWQAN